MREFDSCFSLPPPSSPFRTASVCDSTDSCHASHVRPPWLGRRLHTKTAGRNSASACRPGKRPSRYLGVSDIPPNGSPSFPMLCPLVECAPCTSTIIAIGSDSAGAHASTSWPWCSARVEDAGVESDGLQQCIISFIWGLLHRFGVYFVSTTSTRRQNADEVFSFTQPNDCQRNPTTLYGFSRSFSEWRQLELAVNFNFNPFALWWQSAGTVLAPTPFRKSHRHRSSATYVGAAGGRQNEPPSQLCFGSATALPGEMSRSALAFLDHFRV